MIATLTGLKEDHSNGRIRQCEPLSRLHIGLKLSIKTQDDSWMDVVVESVDERQQTATASNNAVVIGLVRHKYGWDLGYMAKRSSIEELPCDSEIEQTGEFHASVARDGENS